MIRKDKTNDKYVLIDYTDLLIGASKASKCKNNIMYEKITELFSNYNDSFEQEINHKDYRKIESSSDIVKFLIEDVHIEQYDTYIDYNILKDALIRSYFEFNHGMKNKLTSYFRKYVENEIEGIDNTYLKEEIKNDKGLMEYIKEYEDFNEYLENRINKNIEIGKLKHFVA